MEVIVGGLERNIVSGKINYSFLTSFQQPEIFKFSNYSKIHVETQYFASPKAARIAITEATRTMAAA